MAHGAKNLKEQKHRHAQETGQLVVFDFLLSVEIYLNNEALRNKA